MNMKQKFILKPVPPYDLRLSCEMFTFLPFFTIGSGDYGRNELLNSGKVVKILVRGEGSVDSCFLDCECLSKEALNSEEKEEVVRKVEWIYCTEEDLRGFYELGGKDPILQKAIRALYGWKQRSPPTIFETVIDSILTQNTRLDRLPVMTGNLVRAFGVEQTFPLPKRLADASLEQVRACKVGYRAKYIKDVAQRVCMGFDLEELRQLPTEDAKGELIKLKGVGKYSADCIAYIGLHRWESAHFDINVRRTIREFYGTDFEDEEEAKEFMAELWGEFAGIALSYLERWRGR